MVFKRVGHAFRKAKDIAGEAYATAQDLAPAVKKGPRPCAKASSTQIGLLSWTRWEGAGPELCA